MCWDIWLQLTSLSYPHLTLSPLLFSFFYLSLLQHLLLCCSFYVISPSLSCFCSSCIYFRHTFTQSSTTFVFLIDTLQSLSFLSIPLGLLASIKVFSHLPSSRSLTFPYFPPSLSFHCPLIFMRLAGQPRSASLSLSVGEEATQCQQLMDFWRTQTAMHHSLENWGERGKKDLEWSQRESDFRERNGKTYKRKSGSDGELRGSSTAMQEKEREHGFSSDQWWYLYSLKM